MDATIFNIQKFSLHDGPGIRSVVFFKGCPLCCRWCANPESQKALPQLMRDREKCIACGLCEAGNREIARCPVGALTLEGRRVTIREVFDELMKDRDFYLGSGGGVTFSGGEPLLYTEFIARLSALLRREKIHLAAETTGYSGEKEFSSLCNSVDLLLFDLKHWNDEAHQRGTGVSNQRILQNLRYAARRGIALCGRIPVIPGFNDSPADIERLGALLAEHGVKQANLLPFHQLGENKYRLLGKDYSMKGVPSLHKEDLLPHLDILRRFVPKAKIGG